MVDAPIRIDLDIDIDSDEVQQNLRELNFLLPKATDDIADVIAQVGVRGLRRQLFSNGSVVTGTLVRNIEAESLSEGRAQILMPRYGFAVDEGSEAHWPPTDNNPRLEFAAQSYGINKYQLAASIAESGTEEHPFIRQGLRRMRKSVRNEAGKQVDQALRQAF